VNEMNRENNEIERLLRQAKLPEPSAELKERVTGAARKAWDQASPDIPWQVPIRRLAISAAAAVLMVSLANYSANCVPVGWQSHGFAATAEEPPELGDWPEIPHSPLVRHLISKPSACNPGALREYMEKVRQALDESESTEAPHVIAPVERGSRLLPTRLNSYS
jgi:hypothetical protein